MSACTTCGKCPCYEHERKTVMVDPNPTQPGGRHGIPTIAVRLTPRRIEVIREDVLRANGAPFDGENPLCNLGEFLALIDGYAQLASERSARQAAEQTLGNILARIHGDGGHYQVEHGVEKAAKDAHAKVVAYQAAEERVRKAERILSIAKTWARDVLDLTKRGRPAKTWETGLLQALSAYDASKHEGSTSGSGEGVG